MEHGSDSIIDVRGGAQESDELERLTDDDPALLPLRGKRSLDRMAAKGAKLYSDHARHRWPGSTGDEFERRV
jgi:hypothetical protein